MEKGAFRGLPMTARDLASCVLDVAKHIGANVARVTLRAVREGAVAAGYALDSRGRVLCRFDGGFYDRMPYWRAPKGE